MDATARALSQEEKTAQVVQFLTEGFGRDLKLLIEGLEQGNQQQASTSLSAMTSQDLGATLWPAEATITDSACRARLIGPLEGLEADLTRAGELMNQSASPTLQAFVPANLDLVRSVLAGLKRADEEHGAAPAGWHRDPIGRHQLRYWDGASWSDHVADGSVQAVDPVAATPNAVFVPIVGPSAQALVHDQAGRTEVSQYLRTVDSGMGRVALNLMWAIIWVFVVGLVLVPFSTFYSLGKRRAATVYAILITPLAVCIFAFPPVVFLALAVYVVAWIHANVIVGRFRAYARRRVPELTQHELLELGLLQYKVLREKIAGTATLVQAVAVPEDDAGMLGAAGVCLMGEKRYPEAAAYLHHAVSVASTSPGGMRLVPQLLRLQKIVDKRLRKAGLA